MKVVLKPEGEEQKTGEEVEIQLDEKTFKSGSTGFYFRDRVDVGGVNYHCQIILSRKG